MQHTMDDVRTTPEVRERVPVIDRPAGKLRLGPRLVGLVLVLLVFGLVAWAIFKPHVAPQVGRQHFAGSAAMPAGVAPAVRGDMPVTLDEVGTVTPLRTVTVKTQINGQRMTVGFKEGQHVKQGAFLAQIDPRPYQAALDQAQGQLAHDQALLRGAEVDLARYQR